MGTQVKVGIQYQKDGKTFHSFKTMIVPDKTSTPTFINEVINTFKAQKIVVDSIIFMFIGPDSHLLLVDSENVLFHGNGINFDEIYSVSNNLKFINEFSIWTIKSNSAEINDSWKGLLFETDLMKKYGDELKEYLPLVGKDIDIRISRMLIFLRDKLGINWSTGETFDIKDDLVLNGINVKSFELNWFNLQIVEAIEILGSRYDEIFKQVFENKRIINQKIYSNDDLREKLKNNEISIGDEFKVDSNLGGVFIVKYSGSDQYYNYFDNITKEFEKKNYLRLLVEQNFKSDIERLVHEWTVDEFEHDDVFYYVRYTDSSDIEIGTKKEKSKRNRKYEPTPEQKKMMLDEWELSYKSLVNYLEENGIYKNWELGFIGINGFRMFFND